MAKRFGAEVVRRGRMDVGTHVRRLLTGSAAGLALLVMPLAAGAESLGDALADAYRNSGLLVQNRAVLKAADESAAQSLATLRPVLSWSSGVTNSFARTYASGVDYGTASTSANAGLTATLLLFDFGASQIAINVAKETVLLTRQQLVQIEQQVLLRAVSAYMEVRRSTETLSLRQANVRLLSQELQAAQDRFDVGEVTRTDVSQAEAALAEARSGLAVAQGSLEQDKLEYEAAVGHLPGTLPEPSRLGTVPSSVESATQTALQIHPSMDVARRQVTIAEMQVDIATANMNPTLNATTSYGLTKPFEGDTHTLGGSVGLTLSGPIYSGGALASVERQALVNREATLANLHVVSDTVKQNVGTAYTAVKVAQAATVSGREQVRAAEVAFEGVREEATLGARTTLDVLTQEQTLLDARTSYLSAQVDEVLARYSLISAMGQLTAQSLSLNVEIYDPTAYYNMVKSAPARLSKQGQQLDSLLRRIGQE
ncbi:TolC family outer membrane protein [Pseudooceanicola algae]|uniref:Outer membrane efflux protein BepC n=1 Tax=Pseudooceanicola algae TaxID=1537215 RepID=A0A418SIZ1_9RHOB|nr:TolC family outer membrane protein [Pseudooceanicola algae]QPM89006.1 Outer membrane efflux protein BepC [Pseudooceanicola algae]